MEFRIERPDPRLGHLFEHAAEILSSYQLTTTEEGLRITDRPREAQFDALWESSRRERTVVKAHRTDNPEEEFVNRWLDLVSDLERSLGQRPEAFQQTLDAAANLFVMRWAKKGAQTYVKGLLGLKK